jgi:hypothetical protein
VRRRRRKQGRGAGVLAEEREREWGGWEGGGWGIKERKNDKRVPLVVDNIE